MLRPVRILLGDANAPARDALRRILEREPDWSVVCETADGDEAVRMAVESAPTVAILDMSLSPLKGAEVARHIRAARPAIRLIATGRVADEADMRGVIRAGVHGFLLTDANGMDVVDAVRSVAAGYSFVSPAIAKILRDSFLSRTTGSATASTDSSPAARR